MHGTPEEIDAEIKKMKAGIELQVELLAVFDDWGLAMDPDQLQEISHAAQATSKAAGSLGDMLQ